MVVVAMVFSGCVGIEEPITKGHTMEINYGKLNNHMVKNTNDIPKNTKRVKNTRKAKAVSQTNKK